MSTYIIAKRFQVLIYEGVPGAITFIAPVEIDLTGKKLRATVRKALDSPLVIAQLSTDNELIQVDGQQFTLHFLPEHTASRAGKYVTDIIVYTVAGEDDEVIGAGDITIERIASRA